MDKIKVATLQELNLDGGFAPVLVWYALNMLDTITTNIIINAGGQELNIIYQLTNSMEVVVISKWLCVISIMLYFYYKKATKVLWVFCSPLILVVALNLMEIVKR